MNTMKKEMLPQEGGFDRIFIRKGWQRGPYEFLKTVIRDNGTASTSRFYRFAGVCVVVMSTLFISGVLLLAEVRNGAASVSRAMRDASSIFSHF